MKFCNKCGTQLADHYTSCGNCGNVWQDIEDLSIWRYFLKCMKNLTSFKGRARRKEFCSFFIFFIVLNVLFGLSNIIMVFQIVGIIFNLGVSFLSLSIFIRRLHDIGISGYLVLLYYLSWLISFFPINMPVIIEFGLSCIIILYFLMLTTKEGTMGSNKYGPDPLG